MFRRNREKDQEVKKVEEQRTNVRLFDQGCSTQGSIGVAQEMQLYRDLHKMQREISDLRAMVGLLIEALGFEVYQTDFVPARDSKLDIRKKPK